MFRLLMFAALILSSGAVQAQVEDSKSGDSAGSDARVVHSVVLRMADGPGFETLLARQALSPEVVKAKEADCSAWLEGRGLSLGSVKLHKTYPNRESVFVVDLIPERPTPEALQELTEPQRLSLLLQGLAKNERIKWAENISYEFFTTMDPEPDDPFFESEAAWDQDFLDLWGLHTIEAPEAWLTNLGDPELVVAVVDSGVDYDHPDLSQNIWVNPEEVEDDNGDGVIDYQDIDLDDDGRITTSELNAASDGEDSGFNGRSPNGYVDDIIGYDFIGGDRNPSDGLGHGTHVTGTISAVGDNAEGIVGINQGSKVLTAKGFNDLGVATSVALADAIIYAVDQGARVINNSWGSLRETEVIADAIEYAYDNGVLLVFASGNFATESHFLFPAGDARVITVNASTPSDTLAPFSNFGVATDVAAPGGGETTDRDESRNILSTLSSSSRYASNFDDYVVEDDYIRLSGTSMAAPHVTGALSLLLSEFPDLTLEEARQALRFTASDEGDLGWDTEFGFGRVDVAAMVSVEDPAACKILVPAHGTNRVTVDDSTAVEIVGVTYSSSDLATEYRVDYGAGQTPDEWIEILDWTEERHLESAVLATWDTSSLEPGIYIIRLQTRDTDERIFEDRVSFGVSPEQLNDNWPLELVGPGTLLAAPVLADLDSDGADEIIAMTGSRLHVLNADGDAHEGWPFSATGRFVGYVAVGDFDLSVAGLEIAVLEKDPLTESETLHILHQDGSELDDDGWPISAVGNVIASDHAPSFNDMDRDGQLEVVAVLNKEIHVINREAEATTLPLELHQAQGGSKGIAVGDMDGDLLPDIAFYVNGAPLSGDRVYGYSGDGEVEFFDIDVDEELSGTVPTDPERFSVSGLSLADLDDDSALELVVVVSHNDASFNTIGFSVLAVDDDGSSLPGEWPLYLEPTGLFRIFPSASPSVVSADLDQDGESEIICNTRNSIRVLSRDGEVIAELIGSGVESGALVAKVDAEEESYAVIANGTLGATYSWYLESGSPAGWPLIGPDWASSPPAVGDADGDGDTELAVLYHRLDFPLPSPTLFVYDLDVDLDALWSSHHGGPRAQNAPEFSVDLGDAEFVSPSSGEVLTGVVTVEVSAASAEEVSLYVDGAELGSDDEAPFTFELDTEDYLFASHEMLAIVRHPEALSVRISIASSFGLGSPEFLRGDVDGDGTVFPVVDALHLLEYYFTNGAVPPCLSAADVDNNDEISGITDALFLLSWGFLDGEEPPSPGTEECGVDPEDPDTGGADGCLSPSSECS